MSYKTIILDTETTGLDPRKGDRIVEIGCIELINYIPTGKTFHCYINPERDMPEEAFRVHGLSTEFLSKFPNFRGICESFFSFIQEATLVIHNAPFDMKFLNFEVKRHGYKELSNPVIDTFRLAKQKYPGSPASLDALCKRLKIDLTDRTYHGALLDAQLLAKVYFHLSGGAQPNLEILETVSQKEVVGTTHAIVRNRIKLTLKSPTLEEQVRHAKLIECLPQAIWKNFL